MAKTEKANDLANNSEKLKALKLTIDKIEKDFGKGSVMMMNEKAETLQEVVSTGSIGLDVALGIGGLPRGRVVEIYGPESSGKTTVATHVFAQTSVLDIKGYDPKNPYAIAADEDIVTVAAEEQAEYKTIPQMEKAIGKIKKEMEKAARDLDFMEAARLRDEMFRLQKELEKMKA